jgi:hypothetical protein
MSGNWKSAACVAAVVGLVVPAAAAHAGTTSLQTGPTRAQDGWVFTISSQNYTCSVGSPCTMNHSVQLLSGGNPLPLVGVNDIQLFIMGNWWYQVSTADVVERIRFDVAKGTYNSANGVLNFSVTTDIELPSSSTYDLGLWITGVVRDPATARIQFYTASHDCNTGTTRTPCGPNTLTSTNVIPSTWQQHGVGIRAFDLTVVGGFGGGAPSQISLDWVPAQHVSDVDHDLSCAFLGDGAEADVTCEVEAIGIVASGPAAFLLAASGSRVFSFTYSGGSGNYSGPNLANLTGQKVSFAGLENFDVAFSSGPDLVYRADVGCLDVYVAAPVPPSSTYQLHVIHDGMLFDRSSPTFADFTGAGRCNIRLMPP